MPLHLLYLPVDPRPLGRIWGRQKGSFAILSFHRLERLIAAPLLLVVYVFPLHALFYASNGYRKHLLSSETCDRNKQKLDHFFRQILPLSILDFLIGAPSASFIFVAN